MRKFIIILFAVIITLAGCSKSAEPPAPPPEFSQGEPERIALDTVSPENGINCFTIVSDSCAATVEFPFFGSGSKPAFRKYENGALTLEREFSETEAYDALVYDAERNCYYAYDSLAQAIVRLDEGFENAAELLRFDDPATIRNMETAGGKLYILHTNKNPYDPGTACAENGYADFGEQVRVIDPDSGKCEVLDIPNPICGFFDGENLFFYVCEKGKDYALLYYDAEKKTLAKLYDMNDVGYIAAFALYGDKFIYCTDRSDSLLQKNLESGALTSYANGSYAMNGMDMRLYKGNIIYLDRSAMEIRKMYLGAEEGGEGAMKYSGAELVISDGVQGTHINFSALRAATGITATKTGFPISEDEMLLKIMAGDSDIDIYTLYTSRSVGRSMRQKGIYVPLNDCSAVTELLSEYHDYISDYAEAENGDIWALPITLSSEAVFYVPENIEKLGLNYEDNFMLYEDFFDTMRFMTAQDEFAHYGNPISGFTVDLQSAYELNYGYDYSSDIFKNCFKTTWDGWSRVDQKNRPCPYFRDFWNFRGSNFDTEKIAFKADYIERQITGDDVYYYGEKPDPFHKWRAFPLPKLASPDEKGAAYISYLVINPYGRNIEAAKHYLNAIASDYQNCVTGFSPMFRDIGKYADKYDINEPLFRDVYDISLDLAVIEPIIKTDGMEYIDDYQQGKMTLDEVAEYLERQTEIALNE